MGIGGGLSAQLGFAEESVYGTYVAPTRFLPFGSESLKLEIERDEAPDVLGQGADSLRTDRWAAGVKGCGGDVKFPIVYNKGFGLAFLHMLGAVAITTPAYGTLTRDHTHTLADLFGKKLTCQVGRPSIDGTVNPFAYLGCKVASWELSNSVKGFLELALTLDAMNETTAQTLAAASYASSVTPLHWAGGAITIGGVAYATKDFSCKGDNGLGTRERYNLGSQTQLQPIHQKVREFTGEIGSEFLGLTAYNRFVNGTEAAVTATWTGPLIEGALYHQVVVTLPVVRFDGETPTVEGPGSLTQKLPFKVLDNGTDEPIQILYRTTDTAS